MNNSVKVTASKAGQVINLSPKNPEFGYIRVEQTRMSVENGWARKKTISALVPGKVEDLRGLGFKNGEMLPGRIQIQESLEPFNPEDAEKDLKIAGNTGIICTLGGEPIYRKTFYTENGEADILLQHDNGDAISAKYNEIKELEKASQESADLG